MSVTAYPTLRLKLTQPQTLQMRFLPAIPGFNASYVAGVVEDAIAAAVAAALAAVGPFNIEVVIDGGGSPITTGIKGDYETSFNYSIEQWTLMADQAGAIQIDVWKDSYGAFPPTVADSITGGSKPTITLSDDQGQGLTTGWSTVAVAAGETLRFNVDSVTSIQRVTLSLKCVRT